MISELLFPNGIRYLSGVSGEVKVPSNVASSKSIVIEVITSLLESVAEAIISVVEVQSDSEVSASSSPT